MTDKKFCDEYRMSVDSVQLPEDYKEKILSNLSNGENVISLEAHREKVGKSRRPLWSALAAAVLVLAVGLAVIFSVGINNVPTKEVSFRVASATTLRGVAGARIVFISAEGEYLKDEKGETLTAYTDDNGEATASIPVTEEYTAQITAQGFIPLEQSGSGGNVYVSPVMNEDTYRAVLVWSGDYDLDAHLSVTAGGVTEKLNYFKSDIEDEQGQVIAALDTDSSRGGSPETITFNAKDEMLVRFSVASYSSLKDKESKLCDTGAQVTLYKGDRCIDVYTVDSGAQGNVWCVFEMEKSQLTACDYTYSVSAMTEIK